MLFLRPDQIIIEDRQRTHFDKVPLDELEASITVNGLIHPPSVRTEHEATKSALIAGERRIRACSNIIAKGGQIRIGEVLAPEGTIPVLDLGNIDDLRAFEMELDENIKRKDLTWQERAMAESKLMELRTRQNAAQGLPPPTITAVATEIVQRKTPESETAAGGHITLTANRIRLAEHLHDPDVAKAKTEQEAVKVVKRKLETQRISALAQTFKGEAERNNPHILYEGDLRNELFKLEPGTVDVLLTDPPYGIDANTFGEQSSTGHSYEDSKEYFDKLMDFLAEESYRVCKDQAHAYVFCDPRRFADLQLHFELAGWKVWPIPLIWAKGNGMLPRPDHAPRRTYEMVMFATKGDRPVRCVRPDVISIPGVRNLQHGAQKPVELYGDLLVRSVVPGNVVLDTFAGSGTIFPAATKMACKAIGIELNPDYANICRVRMNETPDDNETVDDSLDALEIPEL